MGGVLFREKHTLLHQHSFQPGLYLSKKCTRLPFCRTSRFRRCCLASRFFQPRAAVWLGRSLWYRYPGRKAAFSLIDRCGGEVFSSPSLRSDFNMKVISNQHCTRERTGPWFKVLAVITYECFLCVLNPGQNPGLLKAVRRKDSWKDLARIRYCFLNCTALRRTENAQLWKLSSDLFITLSLVNYFVR